MLNKLKQLGPGLLYAGAAIGVSHLVQSTRAGANFGFTLIWVIVIAHFFKYPFFQFGPRYTAATGKSLLSGYQKMGNWALVLFGLLTISTMFVVEAAIIAVTAGMAENLFQLGFDTLTWGAIILAICLGILVWGKYSLLDNLVKVIIVVLSITTVAAFVAFFYNLQLNTQLFGDFNWRDNTDVFFLIALMGWMPAPLDISVWHSVWSVANNREKKEKTSLKNALFDFNVGYFGTAILACCFLGLGALALFNSNLTLSSNAAGFAKQINEVYTNSLGNWAFYVIAIAAFTTMFSTAITCLDAFPRVLRPISKMLVSRLNEKTLNRKIYNVWIGITAGGTIAILIFFLSSMKQLVDFATTLSFLTTPVIAWLNYRVIFKGDISLEFIPSKKMKLLSQAGLLFLLGFTVFFLVARFFI